MSECHRGICRRTTRKGDETFQKTVFPNIVKRYPPEEAETQGWGYNSSPLPYNINQSLRIRIRRKRLPPPSSAPNQPTHKLTPQNQPPTPPPFIFKPRSTTHTLRTHRRHPHRFIRYPAYACALTNTSTPASLSVPASAGVSSSTYPSHACAPTRP